MSSKNIEIYQIDAFTNVPFKGNPAGVCLLEEDIPDALKQSIATEMNLSETAFILKKVNHYEIRFFTPKVEISLCGHATLASAHLLYEINHINKADEIIFKTKSETLKVCYEDTYIKMNFPLDPVKQIDIPRGFENILGFLPYKVYKGILLNYYIIELKTANAVRMLNPNLQYMEEKSIPALLVTAPGDEPNIDYVLRFFAPEYGINEDPVTGSAQCNLGYFWKMRFEKSDFNVKQLSERSGFMKVRVLDQRIEILGNAVTVFKIHFCL